MKTILFVVNKKNYNLYNRSSAIDSILYSILEKLSERYQIYVNDEKFVYKENASSTPIFELSSTQPFKVFVPSIIKRNINDYSLLQSNSYLFHKIKNKVKPDIIIELMRYGSSLGVLLKEYFKVPLIVYFDAPSVEERKFFYKGLSLFDYQANKRENLTIKNADRVIVYTQPVKDYWLRRIQNLDKEKFNVFQTLDYTRLDFIQDKKFNEIPIIGFIGSFLKWHRLDMLIYAFNKIREDKIQAKLLLVGAGEEYHNILTLAQKSKFHEDITLTGFVDGFQLKENRNRIDIGVMPGTNWYCMPTKVFEYGAAQIPSVAPKTKNMEFLFKEGSQIALFRQNKKEDLYRTLRNMILHFEERKIYGKNLQQLVGEKNTAENALAFYTKTIESCFK